MRHSRWPFDQPRDCAVITLRSIIFEGCPVLYVSHDAEDHGWQFLDGKPLDTTNAAVVALEEIIGLDASLIELADMPPGWCARRDQAACPWRRSPVNGG